MDILITTATQMESALLRKWLGGETFPETSTGSLKWGKLSLRFLPTGIGMVNTAYHLGRFFMRHRPALAIQLGIAGTFDRNIALGQVVEIGTEIYAELGAESPEGFLDLEAMGFSNFSIGEQQFGNVLENPHKSMTDLPRLKGLTVNRVHGKADSIAAAELFWKPEVESMEGAAFFQCCLMEGIPFYAFRGISNHVEPRDRANWKIREAAENVQEFVYDFLQKINSEIE